MALVWFGIAAIEPYQNLLISYFIEYLRAVVAGIWVSAAAPILFMKAGLIERET